ncbi:MAG: class I SAM-dependent methyltransferase [Verrucomicrobiota bacterium]
MSNSPASEVDYRSRIKTPGQAESYRRRPQKKHDAEMKLMEREFSSVPSSIRTILDAPCGNGRMSLFLARKGLSVTGADLSDSTLAISSEEAENRNLKPTFVKEDLEALTFSDASFDAALCFRFFHHLPDAESRARVVGELCRVSRHRVYLSYLSPWSPTSLRRMVRSKIGQASMQQITRLSEVEGYFNNHGFHLIGNLPQKALVHSLHLAIFARS